MNLIVIKDEINKKDAINSKEGSLIFEKIKPFVEKKEKVVIDFTDIDLVLSTFLNPAIGQLYFLFDKDKVDYTLEYSNLMDVDKETLDKVIQNAINKKESKPSINEGLVDG